MRTKRLIERVDGHMARIDGHMARIDGHMVRGNELMTRLDKRLGSLDKRLENLDEELRLSRESRERMVDDFRALAHETQARFEHLVRGFEMQIAKNYRALDRVLYATAENGRSLQSLLHAVDSQSAAIQHVLARLPPLPDEG